MESPMIRATWQTAILGAASNIIGQAISSYQANAPFVLDFSDIINFILYSVLQTPPNFVWQAWLEKTFPGHTADSTKRIDGDEKSKDPPSGEKKLNLRNTAIKFILDQTVGATINTVMFIAGMDLLRGQTLNFAIQHCKAEFWDLMIAGYKMWPAVSITSFLIIPVEQRVVFGSIAGLFWGIYLSLLTSSK